MPDDLNTNDPRYADVKREVEALKGFYIHLLVFVCVMSGLIGINMVTGKPLWVQWPLLGWGLGLVGHAIGVFAPWPLLSRKWEEREINKRLSKH